MDFKDLASNLGVDEDDFIALADLFIATTRADMDKIKKSVLDNNPADAAAASHSIKGAAGNLGFKDIFTLAREMEMQAKEGILDGFAANIRDLETMVDTISHR